MAFPYDELQAFSLEPKPPTPILLMGGHRFDVTIASSRQQYEKMLTHLLWITYRRGFPAIGSSTLTSDRGWGCMHRCGQMMLAQALLRAKMHHTHATSTRSKHTEDNTKTPLVDDDAYESLRRSIVHMFEDHPRAPFSLHHIATTGAAFDTPVGEWFGPNMFAQSIKRVVHRWGHPEELSVYVTENAILAKRDLILRTQWREAWSTVLLLVPIQLGIDHVDAAFAPALHRVLEMEESVGILGGGTSAGHYYIGYSGDDLVMLDPHTTQQYFDMADPSFSLHTYTCRTPDKMPLTRSNSSLCLGFICNSEADLDKIMAQLKEANDLISPLHFVSTCEELPPPVSFEDYDLSYSVIAARTASGASFTDTDAVDVLDESNLPRPTKTTLFYKSEEIDDDFVLISEN